MELISEEWACKLCGFNVWRPRVECEATKMNVDFRHYGPTQQPIRTEGLLHCRGMIVRTGNEAKGFKQTSTIQTNYPKQKHGSSRMTESKRKELKQAQRLRRKALKDQSI